MAKMEIIETGLSGYPSKLEAFDIVLNADEALELIQKLTAQLARPSLRDNAVCPSSSILVQDKGRSTHKFFISIDHEYYNEWREEQKEILNRIDYKNGEQNAAI